MKDKRGNLAVIYVLVATFQQDGAEVLWQIMTTYLVLWVLSLVDPKGYGVDWTCSHSPLLSPYA